jgi:hypothetical protein
VKTAVAAIVAVVVALFAANLLGVAVAESPTTTALRTVSVQGVATVSIGQADNAAEATAVYREAQGSAVADGQGKAAFLAGKVTGSVAQVQSVVEGGGYISCTAAGDTEYAEYEGEEPDFGSAPQPNVVTPLSASSPTKESSPAVHKAKLKPKKRKHTTASKAAAGTCKLTAQVSLVYAMD